MQTERMSYAAICECGVVRHSMRIDRRNLKTIGKQVKSWIRDGFLVKPVTDSYIRDHSGACQCESEVAS